MTPAAIAIFVCGVAVGIALVCYIAHLLTTRNPTE